MGCPAPSVQIKSVPCEYLCRVQTQYDQILDWFRYDQTRPAKTNKVFALTHLINLLLPHAMGWVDTYRFELIHFTSVTSDGTDMKVLVGMGLLRNVVRIPAAWHGVCIHILHT